MAFLNGDLELTYEGLKEKGNGMVSIKRVLFRAYL